MDPNEDDPDWIIQAQASLDLTDHIPLSAIQRIENTLQDMEKSIQEIRSLVNTVTAKQSKSKKHGQVAAAEYSAKIRRGR